MTSGNIIIKFDDILVDTMFARYRLIRKRWSRFNRWFIDFGPLNKKDVYSREYENIYDWLLKPILRTLDKETTIEVINSVETDLARHVNNNIYDSVTVTNIAKKTVFNPAYIESGIIETIYILYDYNNLTEKTQKEKAIHTLFKNNKITDIGYPSDRKLSDVFKEKNISWNLFITDSVEDIQDVAENCIRERKEFLLPKYKYVRLPEKVKKLIEYDYGSVNYYDPF